MISEKVLNQVDGLPVPQWEWPDNKPYVYITESGKRLCHRCVNGENGAKTLTSNAREWNVVDVRHGDFDTCEHCRAAIILEYDPADFEEA